MAYKKYFETHWLIWFFIHKLNLYFGTLMTPLGLSSYVFFKIDLYVRAYTWRKNFVSWDFHTTCVL